MKDFFKELNIIDILGIGVPGCLLVLLLGGDQTAELLWMEQFQSHPLAFGIILIAVGSVVGMLIQELGDMIEKGLWLIPWLDPKIYAACVVSLNSLSDTKEKDLKNHQYATPSGKLATILKWICGITSLGAVFCTSVVFPFSMWHAAHAIDSTAWIRFPAWLGLIPLILTGIAAAWRFPKVIRENYLDIEDDANNDGDDDGDDDDAKEDKEEAKAKKRIQTVCNANPYIQTKLVGHGNTSKRTLYDGWRFVMRNLILVLAITNLISLWKPLDFYRKVAMKMVSIDGSMTCNMFWLTLILSVALSLMLVRYFHYAFLRYKYSLEDYLELPDPT